MSYDNPKPIKKRPNLLDIDWRDLFHGLFMAVAGGTLTAVADGINLINQSGFTNGIYDLFTFEHLKAHVGVGALAGLSYLVKKLATNSDGKLLKKEDK